MQLIFPNYSLLIIRPSSLGLQSFSWFLSRFPNSNSKPLSPIYTPSPNQPSSNERPSNDASRFNFSSLIHSALSSIIIFSQRSLPASKLTNLYSCTLWHAHRVRTAMLSLAATLMLGRLYHTRRCAQAHWPRQPNRPEGGLQTSRCGW
jgi:hypothetical protein